MSTVSSDRTPAPEAPAKRRTDETTWGVWAALAVPALLLLFGSVAAALSMLTLDFEESDIKFGLLSAMVLFAVMGGGLIGFVYLRGGNAWAALRLARPPSRRHLLLTLKHYGAYFLTTLAALTLLAYLAPQFNPDQTQDLGLAEPEALTDTVLLFFLLVVLTPVAEELVFRGFMFQGLKRRLGWVYAAIISSVIFGVFHGQPNVGVDASILGFFSARLLHVTGNLWASILLHGLKNSVAFGLRYLIE